MAKLTIKMLKDAGACASEVKRLEGLFGSSVEITEEFCVEHASVCDWEWASRLLGPRDQAEYDRVTALARAEYDRVTTLARAECGRVMDAARAEFDCVTAPAQAEYDRVVAVAWAEYGRVLAAVWARLWLASDATP